MRLAKYLALAGVCSRREATRRISQGRVTIDGRLANHTDTDSQGSQICCDGIEVHADQIRCYWLLNKPVGIDCRLLPERADSLYHLIKHLPRVYPVGRLDKDSHGLLLLTNDGDLCHQLMHPSFCHKKAYLVTVAGMIDHKFVTLMSQGVSYKNVTTLPCQVEHLNSQQFKIVLTQGLNRQIRRMSLALGQRVIGLQRIAIGDYGLDEARAEGELWPLSAEDLPKLFSSPSQAMDTE